MKKLLDEYYVCGVEILTRSHSIMFDIVVCMCKSLIQTLRKVLDVNNLGHVSIAAADGTWDIADGMLEDADLAAAVTYIGFVESDIL